MKALGNFFSIVIHCAIPALLAAIIHIVQDARQQK
jgi:hypothetical protein